MSNSSQSTIAALATPSGVGGIAVIRISGPKTLDLASSLTNKPARTFRNRYAVFSSLYNPTGTEIDQAILLFYKAPNSYTGEDVLEISTHGGSVIPRIVLDSCFSRGCKPAEPGEFTKRAFLNGKMDLSQAEAVADVISSKTQLSQSFSYKMMSGKFSNLINQLKQELINTISVIEAELDFSYDEVPSVDITTKESLIQSVILEIENLLSTFSTGRLLLDGATVSIVGHPNVGKSSLLNALLSEERVIVTDIPGTTRDAVEVLYQVNGFLIKFVDTAGLRETNKKIERLGVQFSWEYIDKSDLILWVFEATDPPEDVVATVSTATFSTPVLIIINKTDLMSKAQIQKHRDNLDTLPNVYISAQKEKNLDILLRSITDTLGASSITDQEIVLTNKRHKNALEQCRRHLMDAKEFVPNNSSGDVVAFKIRDALSQLDTILGITTADDIINNIFSKFCVGK